MTREERFENMLCDVQKQYQEICVKMDRMKAEGKTKTVSFRELMGNKLMLQTMLDFYRRYDLVE